MLLTRKGSLAPAAAETVLLPLRARLQAVYLHHVGGAGKGILDLSELNRGAAWRKVTRPGEKLLLVPHEPCSLGSRCRRRLQIINCSPSRLSYIVAVLLTDSHWPFADNWYDSTGIRAHQNHAVCPTEDWSNGKPS